jgi:aminopeptidase N
MKKTLALALAVVALQLPTSPPAHANEAMTKFVCARGHVHFFENAIPGQQNFAPDRLVDTLHLALDVTPNFAEQTIAATATITFKPIAAPLRELTLNAVDLNIASIESDHAIQAWQATLDKVVITFKKQIKVGKNSRVTIRYTAEPKQGLYFRTEAMGYPKGDDHLWTQGEPHMHRHWFPSHDFPNEKFTTEIICRVPRGMTVLSNGQLVAQTADAADGRVAFHWKQEKPHVNYLVSLVAGHLRKLEDRHKDIPLAFYTPPSEFAEAANSFRDTRPIMEFFEKEIGVAYPWDKYFNVCVHGFMWGGMENTSITTLTTRTLFSNESENLHSSQALDAHELAHQWFGDLVTCKDWSHLWLNEGFATYYESLYDEHKNGRDAHLYDMYRNAAGIIAKKNDTRAIHSRKFGDPEDQFRQYGYLAYPKGAWVLHMLRAQLGPDLFRKCIQTYLKRHAYQSVVTEDLNSVIEEVSGRSFDRFFNQWVYHAHHPELAISYSWDETAKLAKISVAQTQKTSDTVLLFQFPLTLRFKSGDKITDHDVIVTKQREDFYVRLKKRPEIVRVDPEYTLLAKTTFNLPTPILKAQLADQSDMLGRLFAIQQMGKKKTKESVALLQNTLNNDAFYAVRNEAAKTLGAQRTDDALAALKASLKQSDARVRSAVVTAISRYYNDDAYAALEGILASEKNPEIQGTAIRALGKFAKPKVKGTLLKFLSTDSYRHVLAGAAVGAMRSQDDAGHIAPLLKELQTNGKKFTDRGFASAMSALAFLSRNEDDKTAVRKFLAARVNHPKSIIQTAAIKALGDLGDAKAVALLASFQSDDESDAIGKAAKEAIEKLQADKKPAISLGALRSEVSELQKQLRKLNEQMADMGKKVKAATTPAATPEKK